VSKKRHGRTVLRLPKMLNGEDTCMKLVYAKPPQQYASFKKCWCESIPEECSRCHAPIQSKGLPLWWGLCLNCERIYILNPKSCLSFPGWDTKNCCKPCHGLNHRFEDCCKLYVLIDGRFIESCCTAALWLKQTRLIRPDNIGIGDEGAFEYAHDLNNQPR
jgi:hypothetical protein